MGTGHSRGPGHAGGRHRWRLATSFALIGAALALTVGTLIAAAAISFLVL
jgi:cobalt-zinc-cadmium efflux system protein